ncbi:MAG TPA: DUF1015 domain-containing protein, partial [Thermoanaerobacterales bacterium]|nr:DUF1015 domain-containing protein [Thermoanaerobacterales bacterium]
IDKPEIEFENTNDFNFIDMYKKAGENLYDMIKSKVFIKDEQECFYIYTIGYNGKLQRGLAVCTSIDDYLKDTIKKHEHTLHDKEMDRINHVTYTGAHTGPIMMTYKKDYEISSILEEWMKLHEPVYDFTTDENISQKIWVVNDKRTIQRLIDLFAGIQSLYIADGHHRAAAAVKVGQNMRLKFQNYTGLEEFNFFLSVLFPSDELTILDYNRLIKDLNGKTYKEIINEVSQKFEIFYQGDKVFRPTKKHTFGMYINGRWYGLSAKPGSFDDGDPVKSLDVSILHNNIISTIFDINDPRRDGRIEFVGGIKGLKELQRYVDAGEMKIAFALYPTSIEELMNIADTGDVMPPKSTWFEPKLRSGLLIHLLNE